MNVPIFLQNEPCKSQIAKGVKQLFKVGGFSNFKTFSCDNKSNVYNQQLNKYLRGRSKR